MVDLRFKLSKFIIFVLLIIIAITLFSTYLIINQTNEKKQIIFTNTANNIPTLIKNRMKVYDQVLLSGVSLFYTKDNINRSDWKKFVKEIRLDKNYPGIQGVGFSKIIKPEDLTKHENEIRAEGFPTYHVKPKGQRDIYTSIVYLEPFDDRNQRAFGYDMFSQETRREAMKRAINTGEYSVSGKVHLLQENGNDVQAGFLAYIPVYKSEEKLNTYEEKLENTLGFVYAPFRTKDLVESINITENTNLNIEIFDNKIISDETLLFQKFAKNKHKESIYIFDEIINIGEREWLVRISANEDFFETTRNNTHIVVLLFGSVLIIVVLVLGYINSYYEKKKQNLLKDLKAVSIRKDLALKAATIGTWEWGFKDNHIIWDKNMFQIYGINEKFQDKELSDAWKSLIFPDFKDKVFKELFAAKDNHHDLDLEYWSKTIDGDDKYIHSIATVEYDKNDNPIRMVGINIDITEHEVNKKDLILQKAKLLQEKIKFEAMIKHSIDSVVIIDLNYKLQFFNRAYEIIMAYEKEELNNLNFLKLFTKESEEKLITNFNVAKSIGFKENIEVECLSKDGTKIYLNMSIVLLPENNRYLITAKDVTDNYIKEKLLNDYVNLIDNNVITSTTDLKGYITYVSDAFCKISGYTKAELIGNLHSIIKSKDTPNNIYDEIWNKLSQNESWSGELKDTKKDGKSYWISTTISPIYNEKNEKIGYTAISEDITDKKMIEKLSITDALTNLHNRRHFNEVFPKFIQSSKRNKEIICFVMMDIDHFKQYNDNYGHQKGDEVLVKVGKVLKNSLNRIEDYCFRLGGEEFGVLFKAENKDKAYDFANKLKQNIEDEKIVHEYNSASSYITVSVGLMCINAIDVLEVDDVYKTTDELLYKAKEKGRNIVITN